MPRGLDHVVHAVGDLEGAAGLYRRLGFTVGARNRHSWGTHNHVVQLPGFFIELLTVAEPENLGTDGFSNLFGRFHQSFISNQDGLSLLLLATDDAATDAAAMQSAGIAASEVLKFERQGKRPDGATVKVAFSLAFARDAGAPGVGFAVCQQHFPENFWNPAFQQHANTASGVAGVVLVAENPTDHHIFLSAFTGVRDLHATSSGVSEPWRSRKASNPPLGDVLLRAEGARLAALQFHVRDRSALRAALSGGGIAFSVRMDSTIVAPQSAMGATLVFE